MNRVGTIQPDDRLDLLSDPIGVSPRQIDLVENGNDLQIIFQGQIHIGQGLGLNPLAGIHNKQCPLTGLQRAAHLIGEVDVAWRIDQVEDVALSIRSGVLHAGGLKLDRDAAFTLQFHVVEELLLHVASCDRAGVLQHPIGQGRFAMVDVGNDAEISDPGHGYVSHSQAESRIGSLDLVSSILRRRHEHHPRPDALS